MEISLNISRGERQQSFVDYLNSSLSKRASTYTGSAEVDEHGLFKSEVTGPFELGQVTWNLTWRLTKSSDGTLIKLAVASAAGSPPGDDWEKPVSEFLNFVFAAAMSESRQKFFRSSLFYYVGQQLDGEYWLPGYRFAPAYPEDPLPQVMNIERVVRIDQSVLAIDDYHAHVLATAAARRHSARLSLLLNVGLATPETGRRWVWPTVNGVPAAESERYQMGFVHPSARLEAMPPKGQACGPGRYIGSLTAQYSTGGPLSLPSETRKILRGIDRAPPLVSEAFDRAARLYQVATVCGRYFPSVELAYRIASIDAVSAADPDCNGFSDFMRKHVRSRRDIEPILQYLYGAARSAHFHGGEFPMGEFNRRDHFNPLMDVEETQRDTRHRVGFALTREAIVNWLFDVVPEAAKKAEADVAAD
jgi:hypothetical protein